MKIVLELKCEMAVALVGVTRLRHRAEHGEIHLVGVGSAPDPSVTVSIGIACASPPRDNQDLKTMGESLVARADVALYRAKSAGRDQIAVSTEK